MANFDFEGLLSNPAFQMGLGILGNNNTENTAQVLGRGGLMGLQNFQQQKQWEKLNEVRQSQVDVQRKAQERADKAYEAQQKAIADATAKNPELAGLFQLDPQSAIKALYPQATGVDPYYQFLPTAGGYAAGNARTGAVDIVYGPDGQPLVRATDDPRLQGNIAGAKARETGRYSITDKIPGMITTDTNAANMINGGLPADIPRLPQGVPQSNAWQIPPEVQAQRDAKAQQLIASEGGQGDMGVTPPTPYNLPRGGGIRVPTKAEEAAQVESAKLSAKNSVEAVTELPKVVAQGEESIKLIDDLLTHKGLKSAVGLSSYNPLNKLAGSDAKDFNIRLDQIKGKQFLQAFETLKGGGQITEIEGKKATEAMSRMNTAASEEEFKTAAKEFQDVIRAGVKRAKGKAGVSNSDISKPVAGDVVDGYRFKGGNPSDPNNWEEQ